MIRNTRMLYWLVPLCLFIVQAVFTLNTLNQIKFEEIDLSILDPYWVRHGTVSSGASSNLGWYFLMVASYEIFGFDLFLGKFIRLGLSLISLVCLSQLLRKYLGEKKALIPLFLVGLSPTLLYFNTQMTVYGVELQLLPVCIFILDRINFKDKFRISQILSCLLWCLAMFILMIYPTFLYFIPGIALLYLYKLKLAKPKKGLVVKYLLLSLGSFILPLLLTFLYITNRQLLIYDQAVNSGMFRGAGLISLSPEIFLTNMKLNLTNLFINGSGYYYEINQAEFSHLYPILALAVLSFASLRIWILNKKYRIFLIAIFLILFLNLVLAGFSIDPTPGLRRQTGILASIYLFIIFVFYLDKTPTIKSWVFQSRTKSDREKIPRPLGRGWIHNSGWLFKKKPVFNRLIYISFIAIIFHHLSVLPLNLMHIKDSSRFKENLWVSNSEDPSLKLEYYVQKVQEENLELVCYDDKKQPVNCRYNQIFSIIQASCFWNKLQCHEIRGFDIKTGKQIKLDIDLFNTYYFGRYGREVIVT